MDKRVYLRAGTLFYIFRNLNESVDISIVMINNK